METTARIEPDGELCGVLVGDGDIVKCVEGDSWVFVVEIIAEIEAEAVDNTFNGELEVESVGEEGEDVRIEGAPTIVVNEGVGEPDVEPIKLDEMVADMEDSEEKVGVMVWEGGYVCDPDEDGDGVSEIRGTEISAEEPDGDCDRVPSTDADGMTLAVIDFDGSEISGEEDEVDLNDVEGEDERVANLDEVYERYLAVDNYFAVAGVF